jgi:hypothetical protein
MGRCSQHDLTLMHCSQHSCDLSSKYYNVVIVKPVYHKSHRSVPLCVGTSHTICTLNCNRPICCMKITYSSFSLSMVKSIWAMNFIKTVHLHAYYKKYAYNRDFCKSKIENYWFCSLYLRVCQFCGPASLLFSQLR